jgi:Bacterial pre-peptidase C-terminal domain
MAAMTSLRHILLIVIAGLVSLPLSAAPPTVDRIFPPGGRRGTTVAVKITGKVDARTRAWCSRPDVKVDLDAKSRTLKLTIPKETQPGVCWLRLYNAEGPSPPKAFVIGTLPEVIEKEPNDRLDQSQPLKSSAVVNGVLSKSGDVDTFAVVLKKGQTLVASLTANNTLGSPMDGVLQVVSPRGFVLEQNDDDRGFDPQLAFAAPNDGTIHVRVFAFPATPNSSIRLSGAPTYLYRLTLTTGPFLDHPFPLAVSHGSEQRVELRGWNLPNDWKSLSIPVSGPQSLAPILDERLANTGAVEVVSHSAAVEREPNSLKQPQPVELPTTVSGHIDGPRDVDVFQFPAKRGEQLRFRVEARSLGSPLDPVLRLFDAKGAVVAQAETRSATAIDETLSYRVPADGRYRLEVSDLHRRGGWRYFYRLTLGPQPDVEKVTVSADRFALLPGKPLTIPVNVAGDGISSGRYKIEVRGLPDGVAVSTGEPTKSKSTGRRRGRRRRGRGRSRSAGGQTVPVTLTLKPGKEFRGPFAIVAVPVGKAGLEYAAEATIAGEPITALWLTAGKSAVAGSPGKRRRKP